MQIKQRNDKTREKLQKYYEDHEQVFAGKINTFGKQGLSQYEGEPVSSFQYDFVIPQRDLDLMTFIKDWQHCCDQSKMDKIFNRVKELGGMLLLWA